MPQMTRRSSARSTPRTSVGRCGSIDRKSTCLNSSHSQISYAVFCLKKKNELIAQGIGDLPLQDLPPAPEQSFVGRVLDQRMLERVARIGWDAGAEQQLRLFE